MRAITTLIIGWMFSGVALAEEISVPEPVAEESTAPEATIPVPSEVAETSEAQASEPEIAPEPVIETTTSNPSVTSSIVDAQQEVPGRDGIFFGLGLGLGVTSLAPDSVAGPLGGQLLMHLGYAITSQILVGAELGLLGQINAWSEGEHVASTMSNLYAIGSYFPLPALPWSVSGGLGWASGLQVDRLSNATDDSTRVIATSGNGVGWLVATGWDFGDPDGTNFGLQARYEGASMNLIGGVHGASLGLWLNWY